MHHQVDKSDDIMHQGTLGHVAADSSWDVGMAYLGRAAAARQHRRRPHDKEAWVTLAVDMSHTRLYQGRPCTLVGRVALAFSLSSARRVASHGCLLPSDVW